MTGRRIAWQYLGMPKPTKPTPTEKALAKLTDQLKALQVKKSEASGEAVEKAVARVAALYDGRIDVLQRQIGALRG